MTTPTEQTALDELEAQFREAMQNSFNVARVSAIRRELMQPMDDERRDELTAELAELTADVSVDETESQLSEAGYGSLGIF